MKLKKILSILISAVLVLSSIVPVFAYTGEPTVTEIKTLSNYNTKDDGTGASMDATTMIHTAGTAKNSDGYIRTFIANELKGETYSCLSFEVLSSMDSKVKITLYNQNSLSNGKSNARTGVEIGHPFPPGEKHKVDIIFTPYDAANHNQSAKIYVNGFFVSELYNVNKDTKNTIVKDAETGEEVKFSIVKWPGITIESMTPPVSADNRYTYTYSNVTKTQYPADATLAEIEEEVFGRGKKFYEKVVEPTSAGAGTLVNNGNGTFTHTTSATASDAFFARTSFSPFLSGKTVSMLEFDVVPSKYSETKIKFYNSIYSNGVDESSSADNISMGKVLETGKANKINVIYDKYDATTKKQKVLLFIDGILNRVLYTTPDKGVDANGTPVTVSAWGKFQFGPVTAADAYSYTYSNIKATQYELSTTIDEVIDSIIAQPDENGAIWSGIPKIRVGGCKIDLSDEVNGNFIFYDTLGGTNRPGGYIETKGIINSANEYPNARYIVTELTAELPYDSIATTFDIYSNPMTSTSASYKGISVKATVINDIKDKKHYVYIDNVPAPNNGKSYESYDGDIRISSQAQDAVKSGNLFEVKDLKTTVYLDGAYDPLKPLSGATVSNAVSDLTGLKDSLNVGMEETEEAGTYTWSMPAGTDTAALSQSAIWTLSGSYNYGLDYPVDLSYMHTSMEIIPSKFEGGKLTFGITHNGIAFSANSVPVQLKNIGETYKFDFFWDYSTRKVIGFVNGVKVIDGTGNTRVFGTRFVFSGFGTENTESPVELTVKNVQTTKYWDNEPVYTSFDALISDKVNAKEVGYNFVTDATLTEDGRYLFKKEVFGYNSNFQSGLVAAYDANDALISTKIFNAYNGDEVMRLSKAPAYFKLLLWGKDKKNPLIEAKTVNIAQ